MASTFRDRQRGDNDGGWWWCSGGEGWGCRRLGSGARNLLVHELPRKTGAELYHVSNHVDLFVSGGVFLRTTGLTIRGFSLQHNQFDHLRVFSLHNRFGHIGFYPQTRHDNDRLNLCCTQPVLSNEVFLLTPSSIMSGFSLHNRLHH